MVHPRTKAVTLIKIRVASKISEVITTTAKVAGRARVGIIVTNGMTGAGRTVTAAVAVAVDLVINATIATNGQPVP